MFKSLLLGAAMSAAFAIAPASAAIVLNVGELGGTGLHAEESGLSTVTATIGTGSGAEEVSLSSMSDTITVGGGGVSTFSGDFDDFAISFLSGKAAVGFNIELPKGKNAADPEDFVMNICVNGCAAPALSFVVNGLYAPQKYYLLADAGDVINKIEFEFTPSISSFKQIRVESITSAVPEPATWAMMITGFGLAGTVLRRRRKAGVAAA